MAVDLKFYDEKSIILNEINSGESRMNYGTITPIKIKNDGTDKAKSCIISAATLNTLDELKQIDSEHAKELFKNQQLAASWKSFSLKKDGEYTSELFLGNINPGCYLEGTQTLNDNFSDPENSLFENVWSYCLETRENNSLKIYKNEAKSQTAQRKAINIGKKRDVEIKFKFNYEYDSSAYAKNSCLVIFPVRVDSRGYGYLLSFQFRASDGKCFFGIYTKGKGMVDNLNRTYGTRIFDTNAYKKFDPTKFIGARIYTNDEDETCFEFILDDEKQVLYKTGKTSENGTTVIDKNNSYPEAGLMYFDVGLYYGDLSVSFEDFSITTETDQQTVYVKSKITNAAVNGLDYTSAITISYLEA